MNYDVQKIIEEAKAARAQMVGAMIGHGVMWMTRKVKDIFVTFARLNTAMLDSAYTQERDNYFAGSVSLADLERRQRCWEVKNRPCF